MEDHPQAVEVLLEVGLVALLVLLVAQIPAGAAAIQVKTAPMTKISEKSALQHVVVPVVNFRNNCCFLILLNIINRH